MTSARASSSTRERAAHERTGEHMRTPGHLLERVRQLGDIGLDPCGVRRSLVRPFLEWRGVYDIDDGLARSWQDHGLVYCFPPQSRTTDWAEKIAREARAGAEIVALLPCRVNAAWLHDYVFPTAAAICYWRGYLRALDEPRKSVPTRAVFYWGPRPERFRAVFASAGTVVLGDQMHRPSSWTLVIPTPSPVGTWVKQQGANSRAVRAYMVRFARELAHAAVAAGCRRAIGPRRVVITRYGARPVERASLEGGGQLVVDILVENGLIIDSADMDITWTQAIDRCSQRTEIQVSE
jgi:hypothetical protein